MRVVGVVVAVVFGLAGIPGVVVAGAVPPSEPPDGSVAEGEVPPVVVPGVPVAVAVPVGSVEVQALALAVATSAGGPDAVGAWLTVYELAGIPVFDESGVAVGSTGDDPVGVPFWQVWMAASLTRSGAGVRLSDVVAALADEGAVVEAAVVAVLDELRAAPADAGRADLAFVTAFVRARSSLAGRGASLVDAATSPDDVIVDTATAQLVSWLLVRSIVAGLAAESDPAAGDGAGFAGGGAVSAAPVPPRPCSELWGEAQVTGWVNWFVGRFAGGAEVTGVLKVPGLAGLMNKLVPHLVSEAGVERFSAVAGKVNVVTGLLTLLLQMNAITLDSTADPLPLVRSKTTSPGGTTSHRVDLRFDSAQFADGNDAKSCALSFLLSGVGIGFSVPPDGPIAGAEVTIKGGRGFGQGLITAGSYVTLDANDLRQSTDGGGSARFTVTGRGQEIDRSSSNLEWGREYSIRIQAQPGEVGGTNIASMFFDGLTATAGGAPAVAGAVLDLIQVLHWDFGELAFALTDWRAGYRLQTTIGNWQVTATICDTSQPFTVQVVRQPGLTGAFTMSPDGTFAYTDSNGQSGIRHIGNSGSGTWTITATDASATIEITFDSLVMESFAGPTAIPVTDMHPAALEVLTDICPANS